MSRAAGHGPGIGAGAGAGVGHDHNSVAGQQSEISINNHQVMNGIPFCQFCKHYHHQGIKCTICGHVGKSNLYIKMRVKASQLHSYHIEITPFPTASENNENLIDGLWEICYEIRKNIFCNEFHYQENEEFDEIDQRSRHAVGFVGDMPVLAMRWHLTINSVGNDVAVIDRCAVLSLYRTKKIATRTIELILKDIQEISQSHNISIGSIQILVPCDSPLEQCLQKHGYHHANTSNSEMIIRGGVAHRYLEQYIS